MKGSEQVFAQLRSTSCAHALCSHLLEPHTPAIRFPQLLLKRSFLGCFVLRLVALSHHQLCRDQHDGEKLQKERTAIEATDFTAAEVNEFRDVFASCEGFEGDHLSVKLHRPEWNFGLLS